MVVSAEMHSNALNADMERSSIMVDAKEPLTVPPINSLARVADLASPSQAVSAGLLLNPDVMRSILELEHA